MKTIAPQHTKAGFSTVELLVSLVVAGIFLFGGYTLYSVIINYSVDSRNRANADRIAYDYLRRYEASVGSACAASTPLNAQTISGQSNTYGLADATITVQITCPLSSVPSISKVVARVEFTHGNDVQFVQQEVYASN